MHIFHLFQNDIIQTKKMTVDDQTVILILFALRSLALEEMQTTM